MISCRRITILSVLLLSQSYYLHAQSTLQKKDLCPDYYEIDPSEECTIVDSYGDFTNIIQNAPSGSQINLCPFFIRKVSSVATTTVNSGVRVRCARRTIDDVCTIVGLGNHLMIDSPEDTLWQGLSFRGSNDHAVFVAGNTENSDGATHTFCQTSFIENVRTKDTRGGALMLERSSGTINIVECVFKENYTKTFGASIYSRAKQLNVIQTLFIKNRSVGYGPAIFTASGGNLMIKNSSFQANNGRESHDVVFHPSSGAEIYKDGLGNSINDGNCRGIFNSVAAACIVFKKLQSAPTTSPTVRQAITRSPTNRPSTLNPINKPTLSAPSVSIRPSTVRTRLPTRTELILGPVEEDIGSKQDTLTTSPIFRRSSSKPTPTVQKPSSKPTIASVETTKLPTIRLVLPKTEPTLNPVEEDIVSGEKPVNIPIKTTKLPTTTESTTIMPTIKTPGNISILSDDVCVFNTVPDNKNCIEVQSFDEFKSVVDSGGNNIVFCGGFSISKTEPYPVNIATTVDIRCLSTCSFSGIGPFVEVSGVLTNIRFKNIKFENSQDSSAVIVSTLSSVSQTTFCDMEFSRNQVSIGKNHIGGAITVHSRSDVVNVVNSTFTGNSASRGGAIQSNGSMLNIIDSKFVANNAFHAGAAIFVDHGNLSVQSTSFLLNTNVLTRTESRQGRLSKDSYVIVVQPVKSIRTNSRERSTRDGGSNSAILSGKCNGIYKISSETCVEFTSIAP